MRLMAVPTRVLAVATLAAAVFAASGCKPEDEIRSYTVPKEPTAKERKPDVPADEKFRMLAAVIPADDKYFWSVKLAGPSEAIAPLETDFTAFIKSFKALDDSNAPPTFTPPAGWEAAPPAQMRLATYKKGGVEMYLSTPVGGGIEANVNRWRKQLGLREVSDAEVKESMTEVKLGDKTAYTVDLRGPTWTGGMMGGGKGPFQK
jgi:hypothetical protein